MTRAIVVVLMLALAGCGGSSHGSNGVPNPGGSTNSQGTLRLTIPQRAGTSSSSGIRKTTFVSPSSAALQVAIDSINGTVSIPSTVPNDQVTALTTTGTNPPCAVSAGVETCVVAIPLPTGSVQYTFSLYDSPAIGTTAKLLATDTQTYTIAAGSNAQLTAALEGVVNSVTVTATPLTSGVASTQKLAVTADDADNNAIAGLAPYANAFTLTDGDPSGSTTLSVNGGTAATSVKVSSPSDVVQLIYNGGIAVSAFAITASGSGVTGSSIVAVRPLLLFVANDGRSPFTVTEYSPPYTGAPTTTISNGVSVPVSLALDAANDLFVANTNLSGSGDVTEYAPPYAGAPEATISNGVNGPAGLAFNAGGDLFVANYNTNTVTVYASPYTGAPITTISGSLNAPDCLAFDGAGDLFVGSYNTNTVTEYAPPYTAPPTTTIVTGVNGPGGLAVDSSVNTVTKYAPPYTGAPITISNGLNGPDALALNSVGTLFVSNQFNNNVLEYVPPYTGAPTTIISNSVISPNGLAIAK